MSDGGEISEAEKLRIAEHFIKSSPPGQVKLVAQDLGKVVPSHILTEDAVKGAIGQYNVENCVTVEAASGDRHMVLSAANRVGANRFIDTHTRQVVEVDHSERKCVPGSASDVGEEMDASLEEHRKALLAAAKAYVDDKYGKAARRGVEVVAKGGALHVAVGAERVNLRNFWAGSWRAAYKVDVSGGSASFSGAVDVVCHYFEEGNVQMHNHKDAPGKAVDASSADALASSVVQAIRANEDSLHDALGSMYSSMQDDIFKDMRRVRPVSRQPMNWNRAAHDMIRTLRK